MSQLRNSYYFTILLTSFVFFMKRNWRYHQEALGDNNDVDRFFLKSPYYKSIHAGRLQCKYTSRHNVKTRGFLPKINTQNIQHHQHNSYARLREDRNVQALHEVSLSAWQILVTHPHKHNIYASLHKHKNVHHLNEVSFSALQVRVTHDASHRINSHNNI